MTRLEKILEIANERLQECYGEQGLLLDIIERLEEHDTDSCLSGYATPEEFENLFGFVREETREYYKNTPDEDKRFYWSLNWELKDSEEDFNEEEDSITDFFIMWYVYIDEHTSIELDADHVSIENLR